MNLRKDIVRQVTTMPEGRLFDFGMLQFPFGKASNVAVILHDLKEAGVVRSVAKGVFYRPRQSALGLGPVPPREDEIIRYVMCRYNGHPSGAYIYSRLNLTEQVAHTITISTPSPVRAFSFAGYDFVCEKSDIGYIERDPLLIGYLDSLKHLDGIPGCTPGKAYAKLLNAITHLSAENRESMAVYALSYPPRVRMMLSVILSETDSPELSRSLMNTVKTSAARVATKKLYYYGIAQ